MTKASKWMLWILGFAFAFWILQRTVPEHFTDLSKQHKAKNCPDGTRTTTGVCLMEEPLS
jgi:hypothetical protein